MSDFVYKLSNGTTCHRFVSYVITYKNYIIYHHKSHPEYLNRFDGCTTCGAYYGIIKMNEIPNSYAFMFKGKRFPFKKSGKSLEKIKTKIDSLEEKTND